MSPLQSERKVLTEEGSLSYFAHNMAKTSVMVENDHARCRTHQVDMNERSQLLDHIISTLRLLQFIQCQRCFEQLFPQYGHLAELICCKCGPNGDGGVVSASLLRYQNALSTFGCKNILPLSNRISRFSEDARSVDWSQEISSQQNTVCVLLHLVLCRFTGSDWMYKMLLQRWMSELQEAVVQDEAVLCALWECACTTLQVVLWPALMVHLPPTTSYQLQSPALSPSRWYIMWAFLVGSYFSGVALW